MPTQRFQSLPLLPGGSDHYLNTLIKTLTWIAATPVVNRLLLTDWFTSTYDVNRRSVANYIQALMVLDTIECGSEDQIQVTAFGHHLLQADPAERARLLAAYLVPRCVGMSEILAVIQASTEHIHLYDVVQLLQPHFPKWKSDNPYKCRILWLLSLGCLEQGKGRRYRLTPFGEKIASAFPPPVIQVMSNSASINSLEKATDSIIEEVRQAAVDGEFPERFQKVVAAVFSSLGYTVDYRGAPGDTDLLIRAYIGTETYSAIIDTKARRDGKLNELSAYTLQAHRRKNNADYIVVVANGFTGGKVIRQAEDSGITLLSVSLLERWISFHRAMPLSLLDYRPIFASLGLIDDLPAQIRSLAEERVQWIMLLNDLLDLLNETYLNGLTQPLVPEQLFGMLIIRLRGVRYSLEQVQNAVNFLSHPLIGVLRQYPSGVCRVVDRPTLSHLLHNLADQIRLANPL